MEHHYYVYIMASLSRRIYVGVTNDVFRRTLQHKTAQVPGFTRQYRMHRLVYCEGFRYIGQAIAREKEIKGWRRSKKTELIESRNPTWADLAENWGPRKKQEQVPRPNPGLGMTIVRDAPMAHASGLKPRSPGGKQTNAQAH